MIVNWRQSRPSFSLNWLGPNRVITQAVFTMEEVEAKIAVISGPRGAKGDDGEPGITTIIHEGGDSPELLDGGNF
jgi:hypothetical protein